MFYKLIAAPDQFCIGIGYNTEAVTYKLNLNYHLMNCYKKMIGDMSDYRNAWTGKNAKWIDECTAPLSQDEIKIFENVYTQTISDTPVFGGTTVNEAGCFKYGNWAQWAPYLLGVGHYFAK